MARVAVRDVGDDGRVLQRREKELVHVGADRKVHCTDCRHNEMIMFPCSCERRLWQRAREWLVKPSLAVPNEAALVSIRNGVLQF